MFDAQRAACVVLDASVLINLAATDIAAPLLAAIGRPCVVVDVALREVKRDPRRRNEKPPVAPLFESNLLGQIQLSEQERELFFELVGAAPPDDLDDGEAASLACAHYRLGAIILDERKARRIARERFPHLPVLCSIDLFENALSTGLVQKSLIQQGLNDAIQHARMRVLSEKRAWVDSIVGPKAANVLAASGTD